MRHHFLQLSALAEQDDIEKIRTYLAGATSKIQNLTVPFCENQAADSVVGYYCALAGRAQIPFSAQIDLPARIPVDEIDMCLVLSNLLENALEASLLHGKRPVHPRGGILSFYTPALNSGRKCVRRNAAGDKRHLPLLQTPG